MAQLEAFGIPARRQSEQRTRAEVIDLSAADAIL